MSQITGKFVKDDSIKDEDILLDNNDYLRARNSTDDGNVNLIRSNASNKLEHGVDIEPETDNSRSLGSASKKYINMFSSALSLLGQGLLKLFDSDSSNSIAIRAPSVLGSDLTWTLPDNNGSNGQALTTNGTGTLTWATAGGGANQSLSNLTSPTSVNQNILPSSANARALGTSTLYWSNVLSYAIEIGATQNFYNSTNNFGLDRLRCQATTNLGSDYPSGVPSVGTFAFRGISIPSGVVRSQPICFYTANDTQNDSTQTQNLFFETGNKTSGTGNSGDIRLYTGTSAGGARGRVIVTARTMRLPIQSSAPTATEEGEMYYDSTTKKSYTWDGTTWQAHF